MKRSGSTSRPALALVTAFTVGLIGADGALDLQFIRWVLPDEQLEIQLLDDYGTVSTELGTVPKSELGKSLMDATVHVSGTPTGPRGEAPQGVRGTR